MQRSERRGGDCLREKETKNRCNEDGKTTIYEHMHAFLVLLNLVYQHVLLEKFIFRTPTKAWKGNMMSYKMEFLSLSNSHFCIVRGFVELVKN